MLTLSVIVECLRLHALLLAILILLMMLFSFAYSSLETAVQHLMAVVLAFLALMQLALLVHRLAVVLATGATMSLMLMAQVDFYLLEVKWLDVGRSPCLFLLHRCWFISLLDRSVVLQRK